MKHRTGLHDKIGIDSLQKIEDLYMHNESGEINRPWQDIQMRNEAKMSSVSAREKLQQAKEKANKSLSDEWFYRN